MAIIEAMLITTNAAVAMALLSFLFLRRYGMSYAIMLKTFIVALPNKKVDL